jgi:hypothetical protein
VIPVDGSTLCRSCGICCGWSIFGVVSLQPSELAWASAKRLPIVERPDAKVSFQLPCALLRREGNDRVCSDYAHRPTACRAFRCKLLARYERGEIGAQEALATIHKARGLIEGVEQHLAIEPGAGDVGARLIGLLEASAAGEAIGATSAHTLLDVAVLKTFLQKEFHEPKVEEPPAGDDSRLGRAD